MGRRLAIRRSVGVLGLVHAARTAGGGRFHGTHHRGARLNRAGDTHLGQGSFQPHHNRRAILNTEHLTTAHNQPLQQHCYHTNCLHPMTLPFLTGGVGLFRLARESGLNAPFGAQCFLTARRVVPPVTRGNVASDRQWSKKHPSDQKARGQNIRLFIATTCIATDRPQDEFRSGKSLPSLACRAATTLNACRVTTRLLSARNDDDDTFHGLVPRTGAHRRGP